MSENEKKNIEREEWRKRLQKYVWGDIADIKQFEYDLLEYKDYTTSYDKRLIPDRNLRDDVIQHCLHFPETLKDSYKDIALKFIEEDPDNYLRVNEKFQNDKDIALKATEIKPSLLKHIPNELQNDKEFNLELLEKNMFAIEDISPSLLNDENFILEVVKNDPTMLGMCPAKFKLDKNFIIKAIKGNEKVYSECGLYIKKDEKFLLDAVKSNPKVFNCLSEYNKKIVLKDVETFKMINQTKENIESDMKEIKSDLSNVMKKKNNSKR